MNYLIYLPTIFIWTFPRGSSAQLTKLKALNSMPSFIPSLAW